jgi:hypothetical protein
MKIKLTPDENYGMPKQVATALLTDPKTRLTNAFRKTCKRARETSYTSATPLRTNRRNDASDHSLYSTPPAPERAAGSRDPKLARATLAQIGKWLKRVIHRRHNAQVDYQLLASVPDIENPVGITARQQARRHQAMAVLSLQAQHFDEQWGKVKDELAFRAR